MTDLIKAFDDTFDLTSTWFKEGYEDGLRDGEKKAFDEAYKEGEIEGRKIGAFLGIIASHLSEIPSPKAKRLMQDIIEYIPLIYNIENSGSEIKIKLFQTQYREICRQLSLRERQHTNMEVDKFEF